MPILSRLAEGCRGRRTTEPRQSVQFEPGAGVSEGLPIGWCAVVGAAVDPSSWCGCVNRRRCDADDAVGGGGSCVRAGAVAAGHPPLAALWVCALRAQLHSQR